MAAGKKIIWYLDELVFIKKNFDKLTASEMLDHINSNRQEKVGMSRFRAKYRELKLQKQQRPDLWLDRETQFLLNNYNKMGNVKIADYLNKFNNRSRDFTPKIIWKKMKLMKIKRTDKELAMIKQKNIETGSYARTGKKHHLYIHEGTIVIRYKIKSRRKYKWIKHEGKMVNLHRLVWEQNFGPIPKGHKIYFKDGNTMNCKPENLECHKTKVTRYKKYFKPIPDVFLKQDIAKSSYAPKTHSFNYNPSISI